jgi:hypothetical protein
MICTAVLVSVKGSHVRKFWLALLKEGLDGLLLVWELVRNGTELALIDQPLP